jgi:outer membrane protein TolC
MQLLGFFVALLAGAAPTAAAPITLEQAVAAAVKRNERSRVSTEQAEAAAHRVDRARTFFFPDLTLSGAYTRRLHQTIRNVGGNPVVIQRHDALSAQANLVLPLFDGRLFPLYRQAKLEGEDAALTAAEERRLLGYEAADAFLMVLGQQQVVQAAERRLEFSRTSLRDMRARAAAGLVSSNDVTRGELESATAERELTAARAGEGTSRLELGHLLNGELGALVIPEMLLTQASGPPPRAEALVAAGLQTRFDLAAGRSRVLALESSVNETFWRAVPSIAGVAQYRITNESGLNGRVGDGYAGLTATWALWDGGDRGAERAERRALTRAETASQAARARSVALDVRRALIALESGQATQKAAARAADFAGTNVRETAELYRQGLVGALEVADANLRLFEAEVALVRERYGLALAFLDLRAAAGQLPPGMKENR